MENDYLLIPSEVLIKHEMCPYIILITKVLFYQAMTSNTVLHDLPLERKHRSFCSFASPVVNLDHL